MSRVIQKPSLPNEKGYTLENELKDNELDIFKSAITTQWLDKINEIDSMLASKIKKDDEIQVKPQNKVKNNNRPIPTTILIITAFFVIDIYYDGKYTALIKSWKKYYQMTFFGFLGLSLYLFVKKYPDHSRSLFKHANSMVKYMPIDKEAGDFITPIFEKINSLTLGLKEETINKTIKFIDPMNGDVLGLRSDVTPQIARYVSNNYKNEKIPLRLTYNERVVRSDFKQSGSKREIFQVGCELIGSSSIDSDLELSLIHI